MGDGTMAGLALGLGVDPDETHVTEAGRPITNIDGGVVVSELVRCW
jgi:hypothetical protein